jgi:DivIVA domain-containing protein
MSERFPRVGRLSRGYARRQVDGYISRVEAGLESGRMTSRTTPSAIRRAAFDLVLHGYSPAAVDAALDDLEQRALALEATTGEPVQEFELASEAGVLRDRATGPYGARFRRAGALRRGYDVDDVDDLLDTLVSPLRGEPGWGPMPCA